MNLLRAYQRACVFIVKDFVLFVMWALECQAHMKGGQPTLHQLSSIYSIQYASLSQAFACICIEDEQEQMRMQM